MLFLQSSDLLFQSVDGGGVVHLANSQLDGVGGNGHGVLAVDGHIFHGDINLVTQRNAGGGQGEFQTADGDGGAVFTDLIGNTESGGQVGQLGIMGVLHHNAHADGHAGHDGGRRRDHFDDGSSGGDHMGNGDIGQFIEQVNVLLIRGKDSGLTLLNPSPGAGDDSGLVALDHDLAAGDHIACNRTEFISGFGVGDDLQAALGDFKGAESGAGEIADTGGGNNSGGTHIHIVAPGQGIILTLDQGLAADHDGGGGLVFQVGIGIGGSIGGNSGAVSFQVCALGNGNCAGDLGLGFGEGNDGTIFIADEYAVYQQLCNRIAPLDAGRDAFGEIASIDHKLAFVCTVDHRRDTRKGAAVDDNVRQGTGSNTVIGMEGTAVDGDSILVGQTVAAGRNRKCLRIVSETGFKISTVDHQMGVGSHCVVFSVDNLAGADAVVDGQRDMGLLMTLNIPVNGMAVLGRQDLAVEIQSNIDLVSDVFKQSLTGTQIRVCQEDHRAVILRGCVGSCRINIHIIGGSIACGGHGCRSLHAANAKSCRAEAVCLFKGLTAIGTGSHVLFSVGCVCSVGEIAVAIIGHRLCAAEDLTTDHAVGIGSAALCIAGCNDLGMLHRNAGMTCNAYAGHSGCIVGV